MTDQTAYLNLVLEKLKERIAKLNLSLEKGAKEVEDMHEYYWENYTEMDQYGYEDYDNQQALLNQLNTNQQQMHLKHRFQKMLDSLSLAEWISVMTEKMRRKVFILVSAILLKEPDRHLWYMTGVPR